MKWQKGGAQETEKKKLDIDAIKCVKITNILAVSDADAAPSTVVPATTSNKPSQSQEAANASTRCGEGRKEGQQSQQQSEEETEEGETDVLKK